MISQLIQDKNVFVITFLQNFFYWEKVGSRPAFQIGNFIFLRNVEKEDNLNTYVPTLYTSLWPKNTTNTFNY